MWTGSWRKTGCNQLHSADQAKVVTPAHRDSLQEERQQQWQEHEALACADQSKPTLLAGLSWLYSVGHQYWQTSLTPHHTKYMVQGNRQNIQNFEPIQWTGSGPRIN